MPQSILSRFPGELFDELAQYSERRELITLCLVSRQMGNAATRLLYRTIVLQSAKRAVRCFQTLVTRQDVASCVKRLRIKCSTRFLFESFYRLAAAALRCTVNIAGLDISELNALLAHIVGIPFPHLCDARLPYTPALGAFFQQNHALQTIVLQPPSPDLLGLVLPHLRSVELPDLVKFAGPCAVIPYVIPQSQVRHLMVCWDPRCERPEEIVRHVVSSKSDVLEMDNFLVGWNPMFLGMVGMHMPRLERLGIKFMCAFVTRGTIEAYLASLEEALKRFKCLHTLTISFKSSDYRPADLDFEHKIVQRWGLFMPTLKHCALPSTTMWTRPKDNIWLPIVEVKNNPLRQIKRQWFSMALKVGVYPLDLFSEFAGGVQYLEEMIG